MLHVVHHDEELDQIEEMNILMNHLTPLMLLDYHNDSNNLVRKILLPHFYHDTNYSLRYINFMIRKRRKKGCPNLPLLVDEHEQLVEDHWCD